MVEDISRPYFSISFAGAYPHMSKEYKQFQEMEQEFIKRSNLTIDSGEKIRFVKDKFQKFKEILRDGSLPKQLLFEAKIHLKQ